MLMGSANQTDSDRLTNDLASLRIDRDVPPRNYKPFILVAAVLALIGAAVFIGYPYLASRVFKTEVQTTEIALLSPAQGSVDLTSTGYVVAQTTAKVGAKVTGRIAKLAVKEGD